MLYFGSLFLLALVSLRLKGKTQLYLSFTVFVMMMLLCGLRGPNVGVDTVRYLEFAEGYDTSDRFGPFFYFVRNYLLGEGVDSHWIVFAFAVLTYLPVGFLIFKESRTPSLAVLIYMASTCHFFLETFNIVRQEMAIAVLLVSLYFYCQNTKYSKIIAILFYIMAIVCHSIIIITLPFILILKIRFTKKFVIGALLLSISIGYIGADIFISGFVDLLSKLTFLGADYYSRYGIHTNNANWGFMATLLHWLPLTLFCVGAYSSKGNKFYYNFLFFGSIMTNMLISNKFCDRIASVFTIAIILYIPQVYSMLRGKDKQLVQISLFISCFAYIYGLLSLVLHPEVGNVIPYHFFFE